MYFCQNMMSRLSKNQKYIRSFYKWSSFRKTWTSFWHILGQNWHVLGENIENFDTDSCPNIRPDFKKSKGPKKVCKGYLNAKELCKGEIFSVQNVSSLFWCHDWSCFVDDGASLSHDNIGNFHCLWALG